MTTRSTTPSEPPPKGGTLPRIAAAIVLSALFFAVLWITVFNAVTAALAASGIGVVVIAGSAASDAVAAVLDALAEVLAAIVAAVAAVLAAILSIFN